MHSVVQWLSHTRFPAIQRRTIETLQVNLGYLCNQSCVHCHVNAGPHRTEQMSLEWIERIEGLMQEGWVKALDLTGGAPEMNPHFCRLVISAKRAGVHVMDRCNLTILLEPGYEHMAAFLAEHEVEVFASLPCYLEDNVDKQRGQGVFEQSIKALRRLNALGYGAGIDDSPLKLNLVFNPQGPHLPPPQAPLEADYKRELALRYGIHFDRLLTITNMPISRFGSTLVSKHQFDDYLTLLKNNHQEQNLQSVMCRTLISVDHQGVLYDCDFNQQLGWPIRNDEGVALTLSNLIAGALPNHDITVGEHCYGCTAGQGSSCAGALASKLTPN